jgi:hypothetical protein
MVYNITIAHDLTLTPESGHWTQKISKNYRHRQKSYGDLLCFRHATIDGNTTIDGTITMNDYYTPPKPVIHKMETTSSW